MCDSMGSLNWFHKSFDQLDKAELYSILSSRVDVFVVEQQCPYPELDYWDQKATHLWASKQGQIAAYCRLFAPGVRFANASIGRVLTTQPFRRQELGKLLIIHALEIMDTTYPVSKVEISAQDYLLDFYSAFGFVSTGKQYLEDGIPHTQMIR